MAIRYAMLIASLPHLPHFMAAERLPINPQRLRSRRGLLDEQDDADLEVALRLLRWPRSPLDRSGNHVEDAYRRGMEQIRCEAVRGFVEEAMSWRSVLAAVRWKVRHKHPPPTDERFAVGRWERLLRDRWERDDFGLTALFPWIPLARVMLEEGQATELERMLMELTWRRAGQMADSDPFGFPGVFGYVVKWDVLSRWLAHDAARAAANFKQLVDEVVHEQ